MKKQKWSKEAVFQSFVINTFVLIIFSWIGLLYILPQISSITEKKWQLYDSAEQYFDLKEKGFTYEDFSKAKSAFPDIKKLNTYQSNIIKDFKKDQFELFFYNESGWDYKVFLDWKKQEVLKKKWVLEESWAWDAVKNVLPYYSSNSSLSDTAMTDFSFINHIENLLYRFRLTSTEPIGVWELEVVDEFESSWSSKKWKNVQEWSALDWKIYRGSFPLTIVWKKSNIFDFIYFIQNVWKIQMSWWVVSVVKWNKDDFILLDWKKKAINHFKNIGNYFRDLPKEKRWDYYNSLIMDFDSITFKNYPDSSDLPTPDWQSLVWLIKEEQWDEKYEIEVKLNFYIKWLPQYRINESIEKMFTNYVKVQKISSELSQFIKWNQSKLTSEQQLSSMNNVLKFDRYLWSLEKDIWSMKKSFAKKDQIELLYWQALSLNQWFNILSEQLLEDANVLSKSIYEKYKINK